MSAGPSIAFQLRRVTRTESEHKNLLSGCHVTRLMAALQDKTLSDGSPSSSFKKCYSSLSHFALHTFVDSFIGFLAVLCLFVHNYCDSYTFVIFPYVVCMFQYYFIMLSPISLSFLFISPLQWCFS